MVNKVDKVIDQKIEEKLGLYDTERRRTANEIRDLIQNELQKRPKTVHELKEAISAKRSVVENHLGHLESLEVVEKIEVEDQNYWRLDE